MARCRADKSIERIVVDEVQFPLGVYPIEPMDPVQGYVVDFEPADGDEELGEWEEWPDRYMFDVVLTADRLEAFCRAIFALLPGRVYPILDVLGNDAYREIDPYIAYEAVASERFIDAIRRFRDYFYEDGLCGFGAMSEDPFIYMFIDEHKIVTIRVQSEMREKVEKLLAAFDLAPIDEPAGADAAAHEHRGVLESPENEPDLLCAEEIIEYLQEAWRLTLNVDPESNVDDEGQALGVTSWRCLLRLDDEPEDPRQPRTTSYAEVLLTAGSLRAAEEMACESALPMLLKEEPAEKEQAKSKIRKAPPASTEASPDTADQDPNGPEMRLEELRVISADRLTSTQMSESLSLLETPKGDTHAEKFTEERIWFVRRLE